jgi:GT2 family glycosyltransferase
MADERANSTLVSIVMPCCGQLEYTRLSVPRLLRKSRPPFEVLFVDAGSLDGTSDYLAGVAAAAPVRVEILRGEREGDFPRLVDQALAQARGAFVAWVNNDVLVTEVWLQQLLALATAHEVIGVVGPMANIAPEAQRVPSIPYRLARPGPGTFPAVSAEAGVDTQGVDRFAQEHRQAHLGQWSELEQVGGFCWLSKRDVLGRVELMEKESMEGVFDAARFCLLARRAGYRLGCCRDLYVHHFGSNLLEGGR